MIKSTSILLHLHQIRKENGGEAWKQFFLGLMDGNGSIQCNHWKNRYIQYRLVIKLKKQGANMHMLEQIAHHIGGSVRIAGDFVLWVENHQRRIWKICEIFSEYPPLSTRLQCQLRFLQECRQGQSVEWMLQYRENKYQEQESRREKMSLSALQDLEYFPEWCSGFIEAQGCFSSRTKERASFAIGQRGDRYLLENMRHYFAGVNRVRQIGD